MLVSINVNLYSITIMEKSMEVSYKTKNRTTIWSSNTFYIYLRKKYDPQGYMLPNVHCSSVQNSQDMETSKCLLQMNGLEKRYMNIMEYY